MFKIQKQIKEKLKEVHVPQGATHPRGSLGQQWGPSPTCVFISVCLPACLSTFFSFFFTETQLYGTFRDFSFQLISQSYSSIPRRLSETVTTAGIDAARSGPGPAWNALAVLR